MTPEERAAADALLATPISSAETTEYFELESRVCELRVEFTTTTDPALLDPLRAEALSIQERMHVLRPPPPAVADDFGE